MSQFDAQTHVIDIRPATPNDAEAIRYIQATTWIDTYPNHSLGITEHMLKNYMEGTGGEKIAIRRKRILSQIENASGQLQTFVARLGEAVAGYITAVTTLDGRKHVGALYVLPDFHGQGVGHNLLEHVLDWYGPKSEITLDVAEYNAGAIQFYKRHGFIFSNRPGSDKVSEIAPAIRIPEREMVRKIIQRK